MECKVRLFMLSRTLFWSGYSAQIHLHDAYSMHYVCSGRMEFELEGRTMRLEEGDCLLIPPFAEHSFHAVPEPGAQVQTMRMTITDSHLDKLCRQIHPPVRGDSTLRTMMDCLEASWNQPQPEQQDLTQTMLTALLYLFGVRYQSQPLPASRILTTDTLSETTRRVLHYVENHFHAGFSLEQLAAELNYNKNYLCTAFSGELGLSIVEYTHFLRIRSAILLFAFNKLRPDEVAEHIGFHSTSYFSRVFKNYVGMAPGRFARLFSALSSEQWRQLIPGEPLMQYRPLTMQQALKAMEHIGQTARRLDAEE